MKMGGASAPDDFEERYRTKAALANEVVNVGIVQRLRARLAYHGRGKTWGMCK